MKFRNFGTAGYFVAACVAIAGFAVPVAASAEFVLPYQPNDSFVVVQGYHVPPTHIKKDSYAIDFSKHGCDAYGSPVVAVFSGTVLLASDGGYNGGYGSQVLVSDGSSGAPPIVARYAHLIAGSVTVKTGEAVRVGEVVGLLGNTGLTAGTACRIHPGTHLHFAIYDRLSDGTYGPHLPEPISGYTGIAEGKWYRAESEKIITDRKTGMADIGGLTVPHSEPSAISDTSTESVVTTPDATATASLPAQPRYLSSDSMVLFGSSGGVSILPASQADSVVSSSPAIATPIPTSTQSSTMDQAPASMVPESTGTAAVQNTSDAAPEIAIMTPTAVFNSSTLTVDLGWGAGAATGTDEFDVVKLDGVASDTAAVVTVSGTSYSYALSPADFGTTLAFAVTPAPGFTGASGTKMIFAADLPAVSLATTTIPAWYDVLQPYASDTSSGSWYNDNWYELGTGFYGTIRSLTFEGYVNDRLYLKSHLSLDEFTDSGYTQLNRSFSISDDAPFTDQPQTVTIGGLNINLQPNKYYRLNTWQDYQNRSVILVGTRATGTAMWDSFAYGVGMVKNEYSFYPYLAGVIIPDWPPLLPPEPINAAAITFDATDMRIDLSWPATTDPDTNAALIRYEVNISTSTAEPSTDPAALDPGAWRPIGGSSLQVTAPVIFPAFYEIGIRAVDDLGNRSTPFVVPWQFPPGFAPLPSQTDHSATVPLGGAEKVVLLATTTVDGVAFWTSGNDGAYSRSESYATVREPAADGTPGAALAVSPEIDLGWAQAPGERTYSFPSPPVLSPGVYWLELDAGPSPITNDTTVYGSPGDSYHDGYWTAAPSRDAYFRIVSVVAAGAP